MLAPKTEDTAVSIYAGVSIRPTVAVIGIEAVFAFPVFPPAVVEEAEVSLLPTAGSIGESKAHLGVHTSYWSQTFVDKGNTPVNCTSTRMDQLLTVLIQTSPIPSHPSTALLEALFRSFQRADGLLESTVLIVCDGCEEATAGEKENNKHGKASRSTVERYRQHLQLLESAVTSRQPPFLPQGNGSIQVLQLQGRHGSAQAIHT